MMTPKEKARAVFDKMMEKDYYSQWLGIELITADEGYNKIRMTVRKEMLNGFGILHGGVAFALADSCFAFASNSYGRLSVSTNTSLINCRPAKEGDVVVAEAKALKVGYKMADFDVRVYKETDGENVAFFRGSVYRKDVALVE